jgi:septum formation protein
VPYEARPVGLDESPLPGEAAAAMVERLARAKADAVKDHAGLPVLGADTTVVCEGRLLGKPESADDARAMLRLLSGRSHEVLTGLCVARDGALRSGVETTSVTFAALSEEEIGWYVATGEPLDKAGAYHMDGKGAAFVSAIAGSPSNVVGLPIPLLRRLLREAGIDLLLSPPGA